MKKSVLMNLSVLLVIVIVFSFTQGCATMVNSSKQNIKFDSEPVGTKITIGMNECTAPCVLMVPRKAERIVLAKDGKEKSYELQKSFNGWSGILGNILWLAPGLIVDYLTGAIYTIDNADLKFENAKITMITLEPQPEVQPQPGAVKKEEKDTIH